MLLHAKLALQDATRPSWGRHFAKIAQQANTIPRMGARPWVIVKIVQLALILLMKGQRAVLLVPSRNIMTWGDKPHAWSAKTLMSVMVTGLDALWTLS